MAAASGIDTAATCYILSNRASQTATDTHWGVTMDATDCVTRLAALTGITVETRHTFDWPSIESSLGLRLPDDYKKLIEIFPDGDFEGQLRINRPGDSNEPPNEFLGYYAWRLHDMRELRGLGHPIPYPIFPEPGGLLPWASGPRAEPFFWLTNSENPNSWPIVTTNHDFSQWRQFSGSACELLMEIMTGDIDTGQPQSDNGPHVPRFQTPNESSASQPAPLPFTGDGMTANQYAELASKIGPRPITPAAVDWNDIEQFIGVALPTDYRTFIDTYGPGTFGEITITVPGGPGKFDLYQLLRKAIDAVRSGDRTRVMPICPEPGGIIAWGETADGWTFSWAPQFPDPDRWSVVAYSRDFFLPLVDTSFSQFLCRYAEGNTDIADLLGRNPTHVTPPEFTPAGIGP